ncbi:MAG: hypothetical protein CR986_02375 [Ignavibacteriae bacterium]|nr:MAG: hypothetical protein CR986_02375 [Ignavibacteriota bacterium]
MKYFLFIFLLFINITVTFPQQQDAILAQIGKNTITLKEFSERYQLSPHKKGNFDNDKKGMEEFLYTLIAENLFSLQAEEEGFDTSIAMKINFEPLKKMFLRDGLYKSEISKKIKVNSKELMEGLKLIDKKVKADFIFTESKEKINLLYNKLKNSNNLDSVIHTLNNIEKQSDVKEIAYGDMNKDIEQILFKQNKNSITKPIETPEGWYIFRIIDFIPNNFNSNDERINSVKKIIQDRIEDSLYNNFWNNFFHDKKITTSGTLFWYFVDNIHELIVKNKEKNNLSDKAKINVSPESILTLRNKLNSDSLNSVFINFNKNPLTLNDFVIDFAYEGFYTYSTDKKIIAGQISSRVKRQIELELLTRLAVKNGISQLAEVKTSTQIWKNHTLAMLFKKEILNNTKLSKREIDSLNINLFSEREFKVIELLSDSLSLIQKFLEHSDNNDSLKILAQKYSKRKNELNENGELGFFTFYDYGEIGRAVSIMKQNAVYGPIKTSEGFSVFKLIQTKEKKLNMSKKNIDNNLLNKLRYKKIINNLEDLAVKLSEKYKVSINKELLNKLDIKNQQMVVFQKIGFGGRVLAIPYITPFFNWKKKLEQKTKKTL